MNTYADNPARGLSKLQKEILAWLQATPRGIGRIDQRPKHLRCLISIADFREGKRPQGPDGASHSRALKALEQRGLIRKELHSRRVFLTEMGKTVNCRPLTVLENETREI